MTESPNNRRAIIRRTIIEVAQTITQVLLLFLIISSLMGRFEIHQNSMEPNFHEGQRVMVSRLGSLWSQMLVSTAHAAGREPAPALGLQRGQIIVFYESDNHEEDPLIKRVIGLPGDKVACCNDLGQMTVNGVPIKEPYIKLPAGETRASGTDFSVTVPKGTIWVMGDNRYDSKDSRYNRDTPSKGFVPLSDVTGRAFVISWPTSRWTWLDDYPDVFAGVEERDQ